MNQLFYEPYTEEMYLSDMESFDKKLTKFSEMVHENVTVDDFLKLTKCRKDYPLRLLYYKYMLTRHF